MKAIDFLNRAGEHMQDRAAQYDKPEGERSAAAAAKAFNAITGKDLTEADVWLILAMIKAVRCQGKYHQDSQEDLIAYCSLYSEAKRTEEIENTVSKLGKYPAPKLCEDCD
jgi:hypothetical protein